MINIIKKIVVISCMLFLAGCNTNNSQSIVDSQPTPKNTYKVTWQNYDGSTLKVDNYIEEGSTPSYDGTTPTKPSDAQYNYSFDGWSPEPSPIFSDTTYTAKYKTETILYTVTWKNYDGSILEVDENAFGDIPSYDGTTPTKPSDAQYNYSFKGWTPEVTPVSADVVYTAQFTDVLYKAKVIFDLDGGSSPSYAGPVYMSSISSENFFFDVTRANYNFRGWSYQGVKVFDNKGNKLSNPSIQEEMIFKANYIDKAELTINTNIPAAGTITGAGEYNYNTQVSISVQVNLGYEFVGWYYNGNLLATTENYNYMMWNTDVTLDAIFKYASYQLHVYAYNPDYGKIAIKDIDLVGVDDSAASIVYETQVSISSITTTSVSFLGWFTEDNELIETNAYYSFTMPNHDYTLIAKWNNFALDISTEGGGSISGGGEYLLNQNVQLVATPDGQNEFDGWYIGDQKVSTNPSYSFSMPSYNLSIVAKFKIKLTISFNQSRGTIQGDTTYAIGETVTISINPKNDYIFEGWYSDASLKHFISDANPYSFEMGSEPMNLYCNLLTTGELEDLISSRKIYGAYPAFSDDGKTVSYGLYPQTNVSDSSLISALNELTTPDINGWYLYNGEYYAKSNGCGGNSGYAINKTYWFKCEPISWNVISNNGGNYYLLSSLLLDAKQYYSITSERTIDGKTIYPNNFKYSMVRKWLNADFLNSAFVLDDRYIQTTIVDNSLSSFNKGSGNSWGVSENTEDKVFMPSVNDYLNKSFGFSNSTSSSDTRRCKITDWAKIKGGSYSQSGTNQDYGTYWTRSPAGSYPCKTASSISESGYLNTYDVTLGNVTDYYCVRPAINLKIEQFY